MGCDDCHETKDLTQASASYRRALAIVVILNLGMAVVEMSGGVIGLSQALKADALDFLGDGLITSLGLLAISRGPQWRARAALLQGVFLAVLGMGVLAAAAYRMFEQVDPEAGFMSGIGLLAFVTNVAAALLLVRHRKGDANVRAVWLFSRNDALGNLAVIVAGGLVYWTGDAWPDLVTAVLIALLFLVSSAGIIRAARRELAASASAG
jgi:cation diffusion facilitator family transporter